VDDRTARRVYQLVSGILVSDDQLALPEAQLLDKMLARLGLPASVKGELFPSDAGEAAEQMRRLPEEVQREALALLIEAALADGKIVDNERRYLSAVARAMGVDDPDLNRRIAAASGRPPPEARPKSSDELDWD
jgi:2-hydroxychromene-2-carboxylate isomerase